MPFLTLSIMKLLLRCVLLLELLDATFRIHDLLFAGIKRMALGADIDMDLLAGRRGYKCFAACACDFYLFIVRMYVFFHGEPPANELSSL